MFGIVSSLVTKTHMWTPTLIVEMIASSSVLKTTQFTTTKMISVTCKRGIVRIRS
jgi:hypothetical protein